MSPLIFDPVSNKPHQSNRSVEYNCFLTLPTEVIQHIAALVPSDRDLCNLINTCSSLAAILIPPGSGIWRRRFRALYDPPPSNKTSEEIKVEYQIRSLVLRQSIPFHYGEGPKQELWLEVVKTLLIESFIRPHKSQTGATSTSKNLERLIEIFSGSDFMNRPIVGNEQCLLQTPTDSFAAVQLSLTHLAIDPEVSYRALRTDYDIAVVYKYGIPTSRLFLPGEVYMEPLLHIRNFWKRHLTNPDEATFYASFRGLSSGRRPHAWSSDLNARTDLGKNWLGYYSCIHPFPISLTALEERQTCADLDTHWTIPYLLSLELTVRNDNPSWPELFNSMLPLHTNVLEADRKFFHGQQSFDNITSRSQGFVIGFTEELPEQGGLPGWRRICFVISEINSDSPPSTMDPGQDLPAEEWLFSTGFNFARGYEGMVIPGGKIMLGRWSDLLNLGDIGCDGPFIFWEV